MDLQHLKQWQKHQQKHESDEQSDSTRLLLNDCYYQQNQSNCSELPLFTSPEQSATKLDLHSAPPAASYSSYFSMAQWQELEVQACIYRHLIAGAPVPPQLLHLVKKSLILSSHSSSSSYYHSSPYHSALLQSGGYWGRGGMDPEPGRCRRTDGKKWRCSRDVVGGYKYCERHMHRGRNRSRKPVETPTAHSNAAFLLEDTNQSVAAQPPTATPFRLSGPSHSFDLLPVNHRPCRTVNETKGLYETPKSENSKSSSSQVLRPFFDDWPRSLQESESLGTSLSISVPGNPSSDVSLKLNSGGARGSPGPEGSVKREQLQSQWGSSSSSPWGTNQMGGPLAEALRSSSTTMSMATSVLHQQRVAENYTST